MISFSKKVETTIKVPDGNGGETDAVTYTHYNYNFGISNLLAEDYLIEIKDTNGEVVATQSYNLATYRAGMETNEARKLVDAIHTFANARREVYNYLNTL